MDLNLLCKLLFASKARGAGALLGPLQNGVPVDVTMSRGKLKRSCLICSTKCTRISACESGLFLAVPYDCKTRHEFAPCA